MNKRLRKKKGLPKIREEELWDLDYTLAKYILPRLIKFKEIKKNSYPQSLSGAEEWCSVLDKMIYSFEKVVNDSWTKPKTKELKENMLCEIKRYEEGMSLFAKHFKDLWD